MIYSDSREENKYKGSKKKKKRGSTDEAEAVNSLGRVASEIASERGRAKLELTEPVICGRECGLRFFNCRVARVSAGGSYKLRT